MKKEKKARIKTALTTTLCAVLCLGTALTFFLTSGGMTRPELTEKVQDNAEAPTAECDVMEFAQSGDSAEEHIADGEAVCESEATEKFSDNLREGFWVSDASRPSDVPDGMNYSEYGCGTQSFVTGDNESAVGLWCFRSVARQPAKEGSVQPGMAVTWEIRTPEELENFFDMYTLTEPDIECIIGKCDESFFEKEVLLAMVIEIKENDGFFGLTNQTYDKENATWNVTLNKTSDDSEGESYPVWILNAAERCGDERNKVTLTVNEVKVAATTDVYN